MQKKKSNSLRILRCHLVERKWSAFCIAAPFFLPFLVSFSLTRTWHAKELKWNVIRCWIYRAVYETTPRTTSCPSHSTHPRRQIRQCTSPMKNQRLPRSTVVLKKSFFIGFYVLLKHLSQYFFRTRYRTTPSRAGPVRNCLARFAFNVDVVFEKKNNR